MFSSSIRGGLLARRLISSSPFCSKSTPTKTPTIHKILDFHVEYPPELEGVFSLATANQNEVTKHKISLAVAKYRKHRSDTGSAAVQLAVMTETIYNLARHFALHKKDKAGHRGFEVDSRVICSCYL